MEHVSVSVISSGVRSEEQEIIWEIENYDAVRRSDELIVAQKIAFEAGHSIGLPTTWQMHLLDFLPNKPTTCHESVGAFLKLLKKPENASEVNASFLMQIDKANGEIFFKGKAPVKNMAGERIYDWGFYEMLQRYADVKNLPLVNGTLVIKLKFTVYASKPAKPNIVGEVKAFNMKGMKKLSQDMKNVEILAGQNCDLPTKIISRDGKEFPVNRGLLSVRSEVFRRMFETQMSEATTGEVRLTDLSGKTIQVLLQYMFSGTLNKNWKSPDVIEELTYAAHKYELGMLTEFLNQMLGSVCTMGNAKQLAILARNHGMAKAEKELFLLLKSKATCLDDLAFNLDSF